MRSKKGEASEHLMEFVISVVFVSIMFVALSAYSWASNFDDLRINAIAEENLPYSQECDKAIVTLLRYQPNNDLAISEMISRENHREGAYSEEIQRSLNLFYDYTNENYDIKWELQAANADNTLFLDVGSADEKASEVCTHMIPSLVPSEPITVRLLMEVPE